MELNDQVYDRIVRLCNEGDTFVEKGKDDKAIESYIICSGFGSVTEDRLGNKYMDLYSIRRYLFLNREYEKAKSNLYNARNCPDGISNPFILLRLGESLFECGELDKAREYLLRAYILEGYKLFLMRMISILN